jgi:hypothetical protein
LLASGVPVVLAGDYNVMPTELDVYKPERWIDDALFRPEVRSAFHELIRQGWTDALRTLHPGEPIYTFWDYFRNAFARNAGLRIDHLLLSPQVAGIFSGLTPWIRIFVLVDSGFRRGTGPYSRLRPFRQPISQKPVSSLVASLKIATSSRLASGRGIETGETIQVSSRLSRDLQIRCIGILRDPEAIRICCTASFRLESADGGSKVLVHTDLVLSGTKAPSGRPDNAASYRRIRCRNGQTLLSNAPNRPVIVKPVLPVPSSQSIAPPIPWIAPGPIRKALPPRPAAAALKVKDAMRRPSSAS